MAREIAQATRSGPVLLGDSRLITIDGPAGSGKSTLARLLEVELGHLDETAMTSSPMERKHTPAGNDLSTERRDVATIHLDDMYEGWTGLYSTLFTRLEAWVVLPLANSLAAGFLVYDWDQGRFTHWAQIPPAPYVIIEGVGAGDVATREWSTTKVWLDVSDSMGRQRGLARDSSGQQDAKPSPGLQEQWRLWQNSQAEYFASSGNRAAADFCFDTTPR